MTTDNSPDISIVVCTFNRAEMLQGALASLANLATDGRFTYEIVVIDNASPDHTAQVIAAAAGQSQAPLRGAYEPKQGIVAARNRGLKEARGRWIAFFDDDQIADPRWLAELFALATAKQCRCVGGAVYLQLPKGCSRQLAPTVRMILGESIWSDQPLRYGGRITPGCGNLMVERSVFAEVGGFDDAVGGRGEDTDLFRRIDRAGIEAWFAPGGIIHHVTPAVRLTDPYLLKIARYMGDEIAGHQRRALGGARFATRWLLKAARHIGWYWPRYLLARLGNGEAALGWRCQLAISGSYLRRGWRDLWPQPAIVQPTTAQPAIASHQPAKAL
ncbi:MAG: glycosyltransferase [Pirellulaceae bacterium]|nr:glycosyltransferase [Pirellulaceae bacterium]